MNGNALTAQPDRSRPRNSARQTQARCRYCRRFFLYEVKVARRRLGGGRTGTRRVTRGVCDACQTSRRRWSQKRARPQRASDFHALPGEFTPRSEIARKAGLTASQVEEIERGALAKLRNSPALKEAYALFKADGLPLVDQIRSQIQAAVKTREENLMVELQLEIMDWWRVHDLAEAMELKEEALEVRQAIIRGRRLLVKELGFQKP